MTGALSLSFLTSACSQNTLRWSVFHFTVYSYVNRTRSSQREHSFLKHRRAARISRQTVVLRDNLASAVHVGEQLSKNDVKHAFRDAKRADLALWRDFDLDIELSDLSGALKHAREAVLKALKLNSFYEWDERIRSFWQNLKNQN